MIYLACPYTHPDADVRAFRFEKANQAAAKLMGEGKFVYSPISHTHPIAVAGKLPLDWAYWQSLDEFYIRICDEVVVLMLQMERVSWHPTRNYNRRGIRKAD